MNVRAGHGLLVNRQGCNVGFADRQGVELLLPGHHHRGLPRTSAPALWRCSLTQIRVGERKRALLLRQVIYNLEFRIQNFETVREENRFSFSSPNKLVYSSLLCFFVPSFFYVVSMLMESAKKDHPLPKKDHPPIPIKDHPIPKKDHPLKAFIHAGYS